MIVAEGGASPWRARLLALAVAIALVIAAVAVRTLVLDDGEGNGGGRPDRPDASAILVCAEELADVCDSLERDGVDVAVAAVGDTVADLTALPDGAPVPFDAWVTDAPFPEIVDDARERAGRAPLFDADGAIAPAGRTRLAVALRDDRAAVLTDACDGSVTWTCIGDVAGGAWSDIGAPETWGRVRPAHADPTVSGRALLTVGHAVATFLASDDVAPDEVSRIDWEADDGFPGWFQTLERSIPGDAFAGGDPFTRWLQTRLSAYDVVATTEAEATRALAGAASDLRDAVTLLYPAPVATADVVVAGLDDGAAVDTAAVVAAVRDAGYVAPDDPSAAATDGLPAAGTLAALRGLWQEVVR